MKPISDEQMPLDDTASYHQGIWHMNQAKINGAVVPFVLTNGWFSLTNFSFNFVAARFCKHLYNAFRRIHSFLRKEKKILTTRLSSTLKKN